MLNIADEFLIYLYMESVIWMIEIEKCAVIMEERDKALLKWKCNLLV